MREKLEVLFQFLDTAPQALVGKWKAVGLVQSYLVCILPRSLLFLPNRDRLHKVLLVILQSLHVKHKKDCACIWQTCVCVAQSEYQWVVSALLSFE